jgi:hypothetical protein
VVVVVVLIREVVLVVIALPQELLVGAHLLNQNLD